MRARIGTAAIATFMLATTVVAVSPAHANDDDVIKRGSCSGSSDWKVKAKPDDGRIEVEGEVDSNKNGQTWSWRIVHNGDVDARGTATTTKPSGSFEVERKLANLAGTDTFVFRAKNPNTDEVCQGSVKL